jgi:probable HAF family extracellular repeat protein
MSSLVTQFVIEQAGSLLVRFSLDVCVKGSLFLLICFGLYHVFRRSSSAFRHLLISLVFVGLLLLPLGQIFGPEWHLPLLRVPGALNRAGSTLAAAAPQAYWMLGAFVIWCLGFCFVMARLLAGLWVAHRLVQESLELEDEGWPGLNAEVRGSLGLRRPVTVLASPRLGAAICVGVLRPVVLVPLQADDWTEEQRRVILQHEFSHIRRHDNLTNVLALLVCAAYWFNPLVWWAAARLRVCREGACDDLVLTSGVRPSEYVTFLLETASNRHSTLMAVGLSQVSALKIRLLTILDPKVNRRTLRVSHVAPILALASLVLVTIAGVQPWVVPAFRAGLNGYLSFGDPGRGTIDLRDTKLRGALPPKGGSRLVDRQASDFRYLGTSYYTRESGNRYSAPNVVSIGGGSALTHPESHGASEGAVGAARGSLPNPPFASPPSPARLGLRNVQRSNRPSEGNEDRPEPPEGPPPASDVSISRVDVGTLGGGMSLAADINEIGQVVGRSTTFAGTIKPFLWTKEAGIVGLPCPSSNCRAIDINNAGQVLMVAGDDSDETARSYLWSPRTGMLDLGTLGGAFTRAIALNDRGEVAGSSETSFGTRNAFFWSSATGMVNLGGRQAVALNENGQVVGWASSYSFFWNSRDGLFSRIGPLEVSATPLDLNNQGDVVGFAYNQSVVPKAFFWSLVHGMVLLDLPDEGGGSSAFRINDSGEVLGVTAAGGDEVVYLWTLEAGPREVVVPSALLPHPEWAEMVSPRGTVLLIGSNLSSFQVAEELAKLDFGEDASSQSQGQPVKMNGRGQIAGNLLAAGADLTQAVIWEIRLPAVEKAISDLSDEIAALENLEPGLSSQMRKSLQNSLVNLEQNDFRAAVENLSDFLATMAAGGPAVGTEERLRWTDSVWASLHRISQFTIL